jgi:hypothetical protein
VDVRSLDPRTCRRALDGAAARQGAGLTWLSLDSSHLLAWKRLAKATAPL